MITIGTGYGTIEVTTISTKTVLSVGGAEKLIYSLREAIRELHEDEVESLQNKLDEAYASDWLGEGL